MYLGVFDCMAVWLECGCDKVTLRPRDRRQGSVKSRSRTANQVILFTLVSPASVIARRVIKLLLYYG